MFRKFLFVTAVTFVGGSAVAADLPRRAAPILAPAPVFSWTGFYAGLNAGGAWNIGRESVSTFGLTAPNNVINTGSSSKRSAFSGGATVGYNQQFGAFVAGVEADVNYLDRRAGGNGAFPAPVVFNPGFFTNDRTDFALSRSNGSQWFGTARGRLGFAIDRVLLFATGGLAFGGRTGAFGMTQRDYYEINPGVFTITGQRQLISTSSDRNLGWALGAGAEYSIWQSASVKLEYLHVDLGSRSQTFTTLASSGAPPFGPPVGATMSAGNTITVKQKNSFDLMRAGINFHF